ncbi:unnamed protein product [Prorocentrum cordatum]|uniref:Uncharacterized protein n=1 Tax=Prorocentrum cordatum TaxID=2364126 RepID=A0ABN9S1F0_9DINO|nr:unnamed protein product [Polarella glacialis]
MSWIGIGPPFLRALPRRRRRLAAPAPIKDIAWPFAILCYAISCFSNTPPPCPARDAMYTKVRPELGFAETYWQGVCRFAPRRHSGSTAARALKSTNMERSYD